MKIESESFLASVIIHLCHQLSPDAIERYFWGESIPIVIYLLMFLLLDVCFCNKSSSLLHFQTGLLTLIIIIRWRLGALDKLGPDGRTNERTNEHCDSLSSLTEPKITVFQWSVICSNQLDGLAQNWHSSSQQHMSCILQDIVVVWYFSRLGLQCLMEIHNCFSEYWNPVPKI